MPGTRCAVASCNNNMVLSKKMGRNISFHTFPKDSRREDWILRCKRADTLFNPANSKICSEHFLNEDFERDLKAELLGLHHRRKLKKTAIPSLKLDNDKQTTSQRPARRKLIVQNLPDETGLDPIQSTGTSVETTVKDEPQEQMEETVKAEPQEQMGETVKVEFQDPTKKTVEVDLPLQIEETVKVEPREQTKEHILIDQLILENAMLKRKIEMDTIKFQKFQEETEKKLNDLKKIEEENAMLKKKIETETNKFQKFQEEMERMLNYIRKTEEKRCEVEVKSVLQGIFSKNQLKLILKKRKQVHWDRTEISKALAIRYFGVDCYNYLRSQLNYPLPGLSSLRRWAKKI